MDPTLIPGASPVVKPGEIQVFTTWLANVWFSDVEVQSASNSSIVWLWQQLAVDWWLSLAVKRPSQCVRAFYLSSGMFGWCELWRSFKQTEARRWNQGATTHSDFSSPRTLRLLVSGLHTLLGPRHLGQVSHRSASHVFGHWHKINEDTKTTQGSELEAAGGWGVKPLGCKIAPAVVLLFQRVMVSRRSPFQ